MSFAVDFIASSFWRKLRVNIPKNLPLYVSVDGCCQPHQEKKNVVGFAPRLAAADRHIHNVGELPACEPRDLADVAVFINFGALSPQPELFLAPADWCKRGTNPAR
jgi:hypothetical protein